MPRTIPTDNLWSNGEFEDTYYDEFHEYPSSSYECHFPILIMATEEEEEQVEDMWSTAWNDEIPLPEDEDREMTESERNALYGSTPVGPEDANYISALEAAGAVDTRIPPPTTQPAPEGATASPEEIRFNVGMTSGEIVRDPGEYSDRVNRYLDAAAERREQRDLGSGEFSFGDD